MTYQVLARKWRPHKFEEIVGQSHVVRALQNALNQQMLHHAYLFTGTRGVGKTTLARIVAKCLNCETAVSATPCGTCANCQAIDAGRFPDLYEIDAASRTRVEDTRELLETVLYSPTQGRFKVYIIDEVHMLSNHSFNALLKTLEEPPPHVKFLLATTDYQKLPVTILSRCLQFHLTQLLSTQIAEQLQCILQKEVIPYENEATELLAAAGNGSMRDALSLLDQSIAYGNGTVRTADVKAMLGTIEPLLLRDLIESLANKDGNRLLKSLAKLGHHGVDFSEALAQVLTVLHRIAVIQTVPDAGIEPRDEELVQLAERIGREDVQLWYQIGLIGQRDLPYAPSLQLGFEMTLLRMLAFYPCTEKETIAAETKTSSIPISTESSVVPPSHPAPSSSGSDTNHSHRASETLPWVELLPHLQLTGAALLLAQQCSQKEMTDLELRLILNPKQKPLLQKKHLQRINSALSQYLERPIIVTIELGQHIGETPAALRERRQRDRQQIAEKAIIKDQQVQRIMQAFDATLVEGSIAPNEEG